MPSTGGTITITDDTCLREYIKDTHFDIPYNEFIEFNDRLHKVCGHQLRFFDQRSKSTSRLSNIVNLQNIVCQNIDPMLTGVTFIDLQIESI